MSRRGGSQTRRKPRVPAEPVDPAQAEGDAVAVNAVEPAPAGAPMDTPEPVRQPFFDADLEQVLYPIVRIAGAVLAFALSSVLALYGAFLAPLMIDQVRIPVTLVLALVGNPALAWFASWVTGRRLAILIPAIPWCVIFFIASSSSAEGDLLITGDNWVGLATLVAGPIAFAVVAYVLMLRRRPPAGQLPNPTTPR